MTLKARIEKIEQNLKENSVFTKQYSDLATFNYMIAIGIHEGLIPVEKRTLLKPYSNGLTDSELTPQVEEELRQLIQELGEGKQELKDLWKKYSDGLDWPFGSCLKERS